MDLKFFMKPLRNGQQFEPISYQVWVIGLAELGKSQTCRTYADIESFLRTCWKEQSRREAIIFEKNKGGKFLYSGSTWRISWHIPYSNKVSNSEKDASQLCLAMVHLCLFSDCKLLQHHQGSHKNEWLDKSWSNRTIFVSPYKVFSVKKPFEKTFASEVILQFFHQKRSTIQMNAFHKTDLSNYFCPKKSILICMKKTRTKKSFYLKRFLELTGTLFWVAFFLETHSRRKMAVAFW